MTSTETVRTKTMSSSYRPRPRPADPQAGAADGLHSAISASTTPRIDTPPVSASGVSASGVLAPAMTVPGRSSAYRPRPGRGAAPAAANATQGTAMAKSRSTLRTGVGADQKALAAKVLKVSSQPDRWLQRCIFRVFTYRVERWTKVHSTLSQRYPSPFTQCISTILFPI